MPLSLAYAKRGDEHNEEYKFCSASEEWGITTCTQSTLFCFPFFWGGWERCWDFLDVLILHVFVNMFPTVPHSCLEWILQYWFIISWVEKMSQRAFSSYIKRWMWVIWNQRKHAHQSRHQVLFPHNWRTSTWKK